MSKEQEINGSSRKEENVHEVRIMKVFSMFAPKVWERLTKCSICPHQLFHIFAQKASKQAV